MTSFRADSNPGQNNSVSRTVQVSMSHTSMASIRLETGSKMTITRLVDQAPSAGLATGR